jgi:hypothetical protein
LGGKGPFAAKSHIFYSLLDTLELCQFVWGPAWTLYGPREIVSLVRAVTGWDVTLDELIQVGERRLNLLRVFNAREGFTRKEDGLPKKFFRTLEGTGPTAQTALDPVEFEAALACITIWAGLEMGSSSRLDAWARLSWAVGTCQLYEYRQAAGEDILPVFNNQGANFLMDKTLWIICLQCCRTFPRSGHVTPSLPPG